MSAVKNLCPLPWINDASIITNPNFFDVEPKYSESRQPTILFLWMWS